MYHLTPQIGVINFSIHNETTNNVGTDFVGFGRYAQTAQWKTVLDNVEKYLNGTTVSKTLVKEVSIKNPQEGDMIKVVTEDLNTGNKSESNKEKNND